MPKKILFLLLFFILFLLGCTQTSKNTKLNVPFVSGVGKVFFSLYEEDPSCKIPSEIKIPSNKVVIPISVCVKVENRGESPLIKIDNHSLKGLVCLVSPNWNYTGDKCLGFELFPKESGVYPSFVVRLPYKGFIYVPTNIKTSFEDSISICSMYEYRTYGYISTCVYADVKSLEKYGKLCNFSYRFSKGPLEVESVEEINTPVLSATNYLIFKIKFKKKYNNIIIYNYTQGLKQIENKLCSVRSDEYVNNLDISLRLKEKEYKCDLRISPEDSNSYLAMCTVPLDDFKGKDFSIATFEVLIRYVVIERKVLKIVKVLPPEINIK